MNGLAFLVRHRTVDLVAMTATRAARDQLGLGDDLLGIHRDDLVVVEPVQEGTWEGWLEDLTSHAPWFNPNKHRYALFETRGSVADGVAAGEFPRDAWGRLLASDRPGLDLTGPDPLGRWIDLPHDAQRVTLAAWDLQDAVGALPRRSWPDRSARRVRCVLWSVALRGDDREDLEDRLSLLVETRRREQGLLIHPHVQAWSTLIDPWTPSQEAKA